MPGSHPDAPLILRGVTKRFGDFTAVDGVSLTIPKGSIWGFLGPNGAGKTTTIRMVMSIFHPDEGSISVLGQPDAAAVKDRLGYLPEEKGLYKKMKTAEIVAYFGRLKGLDRETANRRSRELLTEYGLGDWLDARCESMSKGMGQKVQLLGTLIHNPELVILDEPFSGLDPVNMEVMRDTILSMKKAGRTVIFSTHVMSQAEEICDGICLFHKGKLRLNGTMAEVKGSDMNGIHIEFEGDGSFLKTLPGVERVNLAENTAEVFLGEHGDSQGVLKACAERVRIRRFDVRPPSLHEVFVRTVGEEALVEEVKP